MQGLGLRLMYSRPRAKASVFKSYDLGVQG